METQKNKSQKTMINIGIILLISVGCTFFFAGFNNRISDILLNILYGTIIGLSIAIGSGVISRMVFRNERAYAQPSRYFMMAILSIIAYIIIIVLVINYAWFKITQGTTFQEMLNHPYARYAIGSEVVLGTLIYLIVLARHYARDLKIYYQRLSEAENQLSKYRYDTLKSQLNPHFLFNSLNTLSGLIYMDTERADDFIHRLSSIYRYVLDVQNVEVVTTETEMKFVNDFLYLNNIRFDNQIRTTIDVVDSDTYVVPMAIQLLIENVIKHNSISGTSPLQISITTKNDYLVVKNNIQLKLEKEPSHQIGLANLRERYSALTDRAIDVEETTESFSVRIPLLKK